MSQKNKKVVFSKNQLVEESSYPHSQHDTNENDYNF